jgi:hypothetical protein
VKLELDDLNPAFYPPRKRWYSGIANLWGRTKHFVTRLNVRLFATHSPVEIIPGLCIPGAGCIIRRRRKTGFGILAAWLVMACVFLMRIGRTESGLAFGFMMGLHVVGTALWIRRRNLDGVNSMNSTGLVFLTAMISLVYMPARNWLENNVILPLNIQGRIYMVNPGVSAGSIHRGDFVAYTTPAITLPNHTMVREGAGLRPVLGMPGDTVVFGPASYSINGQEHPNQPAMPVTGSFTVPAGCWFVWPVYPPQMGVADQQRVMQALVENWNTMALVKQEQLLGSLRHWWFWMKQTAQ